MLMSFFSFWLSRTVGGALGALLGALGALLGFRVEGSDAMLGAP